MKVFAGLDVHSKQCTFVIQDESGAMVSKGQFATTLEGIAEWVKAHSLDEEATVGMETGTVSPFVTRALQSHGLKKVRVIKAEEVRAKARRKTQKSDSTDALAICEGIRRDIYECVVYLPTKEVQRLREQLNRRRHFVSLATAEVNSIKGILRKAGLGTLYRSLSSEKAFETLLEKPQLDEQLKADIGSHQRMWSAARAEVKALDEALKQSKATCSEELERLQTVPGVGPIVALTAIAFFAEPKRFQDAKHAGSYTGLAPQMYNSADRELYGHITKQGPHELRAMLCEAAQHARQKGHPLHGIYKKVALKKGHKVAAIAIAHRLARILWSMMKNKKAFDATRFINNAAWNDLMKETTPAEIGHELS